MITEAQLEQLCLEWFQTVGYDYIGIKGQNTWNGEAAKLEKSYKANKTIKEKK